MQKLVIRCLFGETLPELSGPFRRHHVYCCICCIHFIIASVTNESPAGRQEQPGRPVQAGVRTSETTGNYAMDKKGQKETESGIRPVQPEGKEKAAGIRPVPSEGKEKQASIYTIARKTGYSAATVSRALSRPDRVSEKTLRIIKEAAAGCGFEKRSYRTARAPEARKPTGYYLMSVPNPENPFYGQIIEGAVSAASSYGCRIYVDYTLFAERSASGITRIPDLGSFDGMILMTAIEDEELLHLKEDLPLIQCSEYNEHLTGISAVSIDDVASERKAAEHIISSGAKDIAYVSCPLSMRYAKRRLRGFVEACRAHGISVPSHRIIVLPQASYTAALDAAHRLLGSPDRPEAVVCSSDIYAIACLRAAKTINISIPEDLLVIGFDDIPMACMTELSLTTIRQPRFRLGFAAFETLYLEIRNPEIKKQRILLPTELIIRETTGLRRSP